MRIYLSLMAPLMIVILAGCGSVYVLEPIGEPIAEDATKISERFDGTWASEDGEVLHLKYLEDSKLRIANLEWDDETQAFTKHELTALLTTHRSADYINIIDEETDDGTYQFVRYVFANDNTMIIWSPRIEAFEKAVSGGKLKGTVKQASTRPPSTSQPRKSRSTNSSIQTALRNSFEVETPIILKRPKG